MSNVEFKKIKRIEKKRPWPQFIIINLLCIVYLLNFVYHTIADR